jgi:hypothetical protein
MHSNDGWGREGCPLCSCEIRQVQWVREVGFVSRESNRSKKKIELKKNSAMEIEKGNCDRLMD